MDPTRTISVTSGKGGVGKTTLVCNLATALAQSGQRVLILDGDLGMANADIMFGRRSRLNVGHLLENNGRIEDILLQVAPGVQLIPGGTGVYELARLDPASKRALLDQVGRLSGAYDVMLIDTAPGIDDNVLYLNAAAQEILVVVTPDPGSLTDAYALIKVLHQRHRENKFSVVLNMVRDEAEARHVFAKLCEVASRFLCVGLEYRGFVPTDPCLRQATRYQRMVVDASPRSPAALAVRRLGEALTEPEAGTGAGIKGGLRFFWGHAAGVA